MQTLTLQKIYKVYTPCSFETDIKGFWLNNNGKLYADNLIIQSVDIWQLQTIKKHLYSQGEQAVFYTENGNMAYIEDKEQTQILRTRKTQFIYNKNLSGEIIKNLCNQYGGCTIYTKTNGLLIEVWTK